MGVQRSARFYVAAINKRSSLRGMRGRRGGGKAAASERAHSRSQIRILNSRRLIWPRTDERLRRRVMRLRSERHVIAERFLVSRLSIFVLVISSCSIHAFSECSLPRQGAQQRRGNASNNNKAGANSYAKRFQFLSANARLHNDVFDKLETQGKRK